MKKIKISAMIFLLSIASITLAENLSLNKDLLEEINIMETVLTRIMGKDNNVMAFRGSNANGYYLPDYGVIFNVAYSTEQQMSMVVFNVPDAAPVSTAVPVTEYKYNQVTTRNSEEENERKNVIPDVKRSLIMFFTKYASSMSALKPDEKITVIVDLNGLSFMPSVRKNNAPQQLTATLSANDLADFKKNKISGDELEKRIIFNEIESVDQDVSIFSNIIQTSLGYMKEESGFGFQGDVKSIYLKGHGILFMLDADVGMKTLKIWSDNLENLEKDLKVNEDKMVLFKGKVNRTTGETSSMIASNLQKDVFKEYEEKLDKIISKYGHTLSSIKSGEYVEIAMRFDGMGMSMDFTKGLIKVKKSDIDDFQKGKIDLDNFKKKVSVVYY